MAKIRTNVAVSYCMRNPNKKGIVEIELTEWVEANGLYKAVVNDFLIETITENDTTYERKTLLPKLSSSVVEIDQEKFNMLAAYAETQFTEGMTPSEKQEVRKQMALLYYVTTDFIDAENTRTVYDVLPSNWELS